MLVSAVLLKGHTLDIHLLIFLAHYDYLILSNLFHRLTRTAYLYNGCLAWYNVIGLLTSLVSSGVKYSQTQQSQLRTCATVE